MRHTLHWALLCIGWLTAMGSVIVTFSIGLGNLPLSLLIFSAIFLVLLIWSLLAVMFDPPRRSRRRRIRMRYLRDIP
jgi:ABC-type transport system involved in cytochrome bd biosynthesis fused ATPase/permease subunit